MIVNKPKYADLIDEAIINLKERTGSSLAAIKKYIATTYPAFDFQPQFLRAALKRGVATEKYVMVKASYKINSKVKKDIEKKVEKKVAAPKAKKTVTKKPTEDKPAAPARKRKAIKNTVALPEAAAIKNTVALPEAAAIKNTVALPEAAATKLVDRKAAYGSTLDKFFKHHPIMMIGSAIAAHVDQKELVHGDVIFMPRKGFYHIAVYVGNHEIIHFARNSNQELEIRLDILDSSQTLGRNVYIDLHKHPRSRDDIVSGARHYLANPQEIGKYNLLTNNCELFAQKCCGEFSWHQSLHGSAGNAFNAITGNAPFAHSRKWNGIFAD